MKRENVVGSISGLPAEGRLSDPGGPGSNNGMHPTPLHGASHVR